ncbi:hypothetical protein IIA94_02545 [Patescibacteria group bacterium]|nr:hypothetical protein [Patescibacteria group bacterium]
MAKKERGELKMVVFVLIALAVSFYFDFMPFLIIVAFSLPLLMYLHVKQHNKRLNHIESMLVEKQIAKDTDFDEQEEI